jgi:hypothetical protein
MIAQQRKDTYFPELEGDDRAGADAWLRDYLRLVIRIHASLTDEQPADLPATSLTTLAVQAGSERFPTVINNLQPT